MSEVKLYQEQQSKVRENRSNKDENDEEDYTWHQVCLLYCTQCLNLEYPGCLAHSCLLSVKKGNGHMSCHGCVADLKLNKASILQEGETATDVCIPWCEACRECEKCRADVKVSAVLLFICLYVICVVEEKKCIYCI